MIGDHIDHYRVLELVGRGAMGVVYKGLDLNLDRTVAIKVMSAESRNDPDFVERFRLEARLQAALNHPNVGLLFDYFVHDGAPVAVMEFIDGESLEQLIRRRGPIPAHESIPIFKQALRGVAAAHRSGIIHRDLKAANLMITKDGIVKVMDFGIAKRQGAMGATKASTSIGSPLYMAPEQILGRAVDRRTDVYALGVTLYQLLSGQPPFNPRSKTEYSVLNAHVNDLPEPPTVHCRDIPQSIVDAVMRALSKEPEARFQSAEDFMRALPDVPAPNAARPLGPNGSVATPRVGPTGTVAIPRADSSGTVTLEYSPPPVSGESIAAFEPGGTMGFEFASATVREPKDTMAFDYSAGTLRQEAYPPQSGSSPAEITSPVIAENAALVGTPATTRLSHNSTSSSAAPSLAAQGLRGAPPSFIQSLRAGRPFIATMLVATLVLGALLHHKERLPATPRAASPTSGDPRFANAQPPTETQPPTSAEPTAPPPAISPSGDEPAAAHTADTSTAATVSATGATPATETAPTRQDLSGTWHGNYVDASGKELLRVVSLSISRVRDDGGIEGTLQYQAPSGDGECQLHPRGSTYSAGQRHLQLSPEGCSPRHPRELGVPLDFYGVNPLANTLKDGRIEAPTGDVIRVRLQRVSGA